MCSINLCEVRYLSLYFNFVLSVRNILLFEPKYVKYAKHYLFVQFTSSIIARTLVFILVHTLLNSTNGNLYK